MGADASIGSQARRTGGVLVVCADPPWPPVSGADLRNWRNVLAASKLGPVAAVSLWSDTRKSRENHQVDLLDLGATSPAQIYKRPPGGSRVDLTLPDGAVEKFEAALNLHRPSLVIFESLGLRKLLAARGLQRARVIFDFHNIDSLLFASMEPFWRKILRPDRIAKVRAAEREAIAGADEIWVCSDIDRRRLQRIHRVPSSVRVIPNAVPSTFGGPPSVAATKANGPRLLFVGHLSYPPNVEAAETLVNSIMPKVKKRLSDATLLIAGRSPHRRVNASRHDGCTLVADPPELDPLYEASDIVVVPLFRGGGTRIKVLEAMAAQVPLVATPLAVEGLELTPERHYLEAKTSGDFVRQIERLWSGRELRKNLVAEAKALVDEKFASDVIDATIQSALSSLQGSRTERERTA